MCAFGQPLTIEEMPIPEPGPDQILLQYKATGVCHTDLHAAHGDWPVKPNPPFIPGHEGTGWETLCGSQQNTGYSVNGTFAQYGLADPDFVGKLPDNLEFGPAAPILCAGVTVYKGFKETEVKPGEWVVISGIGGLGHLAVQYAKAMGMHVVATDIFDERLALAKTLGADITVYGKDADAIQQVQKATGGVHGALVTAVSPQAMEQAFGFLRVKGTMSLVGLPPGFISLPVLDTVLKRITVRCSIGGTRQDLEESLMFAGEGKVASHFSWDRIENINDIFHRMEAGKIDGRIVLDLS